MAPSRPGGQSYYDVLTAAIDDMIANGYDSPERVAHWMNELRRAAERSLATVAQMEEILREALAQVYRRMVDRGQIAQYHSGVGRFTVEKLRPQLRAELNRRVVASADLIKLNRQEAINTTLRRFSGWATSVPKGGTETAQKAQEKRDIRKPLAQVKFRERRVVIDQTHKLVANINDIVATDGGAIGGFWKSNWRQAGYDYREDHKERDGKFYAIAGSWAARDGLIKKGVDWQDRITKPAEEPFCRCRYQFVYNLRDVPAEYLTEKGRAALAAARKKIKEMA